MKNLNILYKYGKPLRTFSDYFRSILLLTSVATILLGCVAKTPQPVSLATDTPENSNLQEGPVFQYSPPPSPTHQISGSFNKRKIDFDIQMYSHPDKLFSMLVPKDWIFDQELTNLSLIDPESASSFNIQVVDSGYPLEIESLINFVQAKENQNLSSYEKSIEIDRQVMEEDKTIYTINKVTHQGKEKTLITYYYHEGHAILILDFLFNQDEFEIDQEKLTRLKNSFKIDLDVLSSFPRDSSATKNIQENGYFSIETPVYWLSERNSGEYSIIETIYAPDNGAIAQTIVYDDGESLSRSVGGNIVLTLLRENYARDISVLADRILPDRREELTWRSNNKNYEGVTVFETRGTALLVLTVMREYDPENYYQEILNDILESYTILPSED